MWWGDGRRVGDSGDVGSGDGVGPGPGANGQRAETGRGASLIKKGRQASLGREMNPFVFSQIPEPDPSRFSGKIGVGRAHDHEFFGADVARRSLSPGRYRPDRQVRPARLHRGGEVVDMGELDH
jgi:hypothetical protein